jgi:hypothetical protein
LGETGEDSIMQEDEKENLRRTNWAIWLPVMVTTIGAFIWFFIFVILD